MTLWLAIGAAAVLSFTIKAAGPALLGERQLPGWWRSISALLASALLAGLIVVHLMDTGGTAVTWTVVGGLAVTAGARLVKAPMLLAVLAGVAATALLRLLTG
jgi:branched-subunit amino acid transport protein